MPCFIIILELSEGEGGEKVCAIAGSKKGKATKKRKMSCKSLNKAENKFWSRLVESVSIRPVLFPCGSAFHGLCRNGFMSKLVPRALFCKTTLIYYNYKHQNNTMRIAPAARDSCGLFFYTSKVFCESFSSLFFDKEKF